MNLSIVFSGCPECHAASEQWSEDTANGSWFNKRIYNNNQNGKIPSKAIDGPEYPPTIDLYALPKDIE